MGVPKFYRWISERYPCLSEVVREYQIPEFDNLYLDMNGIIHSCSHPNDEDVHFRIPEEKIFQDIFKYIEFLFRMIKPRKVFFMAVDGVAPRAKMNQQRGRRFRSAKEADDRENEAREKGEILPQEARFDSNCITPGTEFMVRLHEQMNLFIISKMSSDDMWKDVKVIYSGHETPGEGEHKIMDYIRYEKSQTDYDSNTRHCLYGLDADLIMLGTCSHEPHFSLLREEVKFLQTKNQDKTKTRDVNPEAITFHLLHLSLFREYIDHEFSELKTTLRNATFDYDLECVIDDWILMGFLVGNDFIPPIPNFHINKESLSKLYATYIQVLPTLDGYLNENGLLNLKRFQKFIDKLTQLDIDNFEENYEDFKYLEAKGGGRDRGHAKGVSGERNFENTDAFFTEGLCSEANKTLREFHENANDNKLGEPLIRLSESSSSDDNNGETSETDDDDNKLFMLEFKAHKDDYYRTKLDIQDVSEEALKNQAYEYIRAIQWNLHYYYNGCCSWSWFYPHHYAPYISDVTNFKDIDLTFDYGRPFLPFEQLLAVLPSASKQLLPKAYEKLVDDPNSALIDYYPKDFESDLNGKKQAWEAVVLIPFIEEDRLLRATELLRPRLNPDEKARNKHGPHLVYTYSEKPLPKPAVMSNLFKDFEINHCLREEIHQHAFSLPASQIHKGLCSGVRLDVHFPGFPTLKHIPHVAKLKKESVKVFEQMSRGESMILIIKDKEEPDVPDIRDIAQDYLGNSVFVNWPHLVEARVFQVSNNEMKYVFDKSQQKMIVSPIDEKELEQIGRRVEDRTKHYKQRLGIEIGDTQVVLHVYPLTGRKYVHGVRGKITLEKQWSSVEMICPFQTVVKDIAVHDPSFTQFSTIEEIYPVGAKCFVIGVPYYGSCAQVVESKRPDGRIKVTVTPAMEPNFAEIKDRARQIIKEHYMPNHALAQRLAISSHLVARITGTIFVKPANENARFKTNIGLNLKFKAREEEIPGYSRKLEDGNWLFSEKVQRIIEEYIDKFPFIFNKLSRIGDKDSYTLDDLFDGEKKQEQLEKLSKWLKSQEHMGIKRIKHNAKILDECIVKAVEDVVHTHDIFEKELEPETLMFSSKHLYRPLHHLGYSLPDPNVKYRLFDRVVNIRSGISVPLGWKGTIIGIHVDEEKEVNTLYDIVFDNEFPGGTALRCTPGKGYKLSPACLINITYGLIESGTYEQFVSNYGQSLQAETNYRPKGFSAMARKNDLDNNSSTPRKNYNNESYFERERDIRERSFGNKSQSMPSDSARQKNRNKDRKSMNALNHSPNSPFESPKVQNDKMMTIWNNLTGNKGNKTGGEDFPPLPTDANQPLHAGPVPHPVRMSDVISGKHAKQYAPASESKKPAQPDNLKIVDNYVQRLNKHCESQFGSFPKYDVMVVGPMKQKTIKLTVPNVNPFYEPLAAHKTTEDCYEKLAKDALMKLNVLQADAPRLLPLPDFFQPEQQSVRHKISANMLPTPPSNWVQASSNRQSNPSKPIIPESYVDVNNELLKQMQISNNQSNPRQVSPAIPKQMNYYRKQDAYPNTHNLQQTSNFPAPPQLLPPNQFPQAYSGQHIQPVQQSPRSPFQQQPQYRHSTPTKRDYFPQSTNFKPNNLHQQGNPSSKHQASKQERVRSDSSSSASNPFVPLQVVRKSKTTPIKKSIQVDVGQLLNESMDTITISSTSSDQDDLTLNADASKKITPSKQRQQKSVSNQGSDAKPKRKQRMSANFAKD